MTVTAEAALERADALLADPSGRAAPLWGLPHADKDLARAGVRTTGSRLTASLVPEASDPIVEVVDAAGAVSLGKTNTPEFGLPSYTENLVAPPTRTPWDPVRGAGGSSGGAAAAVAAGLLPAAVGSDGGGSIRIPAAACGIVGLKPSRGRVPALGGFGFLAGLPTAGPLARTVEDAALLLDAILPAPPRAGATAGSDLGAAWATVAPTWDGGPYLGAAMRGEGRFQLAVSTDSPWRTHPTSPWISEARALDLALAELSALGHGIQELAIPEDPGYPRVPHGLAGGRRLDPRGGSSWSCSSRSRGGWSAWALGLYAHWRGARAPRRLRAGHDRPVRAVRRRAHADARVPPPSAGTTRRTASATSPSRCR